MKKYYKSTESGNIFLYVLIAIVLFASLTFVLSRGQGGNNKTVLDQATLQTTMQRLTNYVGDVSQAWVQMKDTGSDLDELDLTLPTAGGFNTAPTIHKLFHPDGGGVLYNDMNDELFRANATAPVGWKFVIVDADFSPTSSTDLLMTYVNISEKLCAKINLSIRNNATIPVTTVNFANTFVAGSSPLTESACPDCKTSSSLCIEDASGIYAFYNMIEMR